MKRPIGIAAIVLMFLVALSLPRMVAADPEPPPQVPRSATVEMLLLKAPGLNRRNSKWEIAYELRITNEIGIWEASKRRRLKGTGEERIGELINQGTFAKSLESPTGQKLVLQIPFTAAALEKLRKQPKSRINLTAATATPENIKLNAEQEVKSQVFLFYAVLRVHDAKLNKTITIPVNREWDYMNFPEARFEVRIDIDDEGHSTVNSSNIKNPKNRITIVK